MREAIAVVDRERVLGGQGAVLAREHHPARWNGDGFVDRQLADPVVDQVATSLRPAGSDPSGLQQVSKFIEVELERTRRSLRHTPPHEGMSHDA